MKQIMLLLSLTLSVQFCHAANLLCANKKARELAVDILNDQTESKPRPFAEINLFARQYILNENLFSAYPLLMTVGEVYQTVVESPAFRKTDISPFWFHWHFFWSLPRGTQDQTKLTDLFCREIDSTKLR